MASIFGHGVVGFTITKLIDNKQTKWLLLAAIFSAILPDFDVIAFKLGIAYQHPLGHRGFTHSILFALLLLGMSKLEFYLFYYLYPMEWF